MGGNPVIRLVGALAVAILFSLPLPAQVETVERSGPASYVWINRGRLDGHLALSYSPDGAFSPDGSTLAFVNEEKIILMNLSTGAMDKVLKPHLEGIEDLEIHSANYLAMNQLFVLANGIIPSKGKGPARTTPLLAFQWNVDQDILSGKLDAVGAKGGYSPARYFPLIGYLGLYKESNFDLWNPRTRAFGRVTVTDLTQTPGIYEFSPNGQWLLLAQIASSGSADPVVVNLKEKRFVDSLRGHQGTVLSMRFSRDGTKVVTACEDGKVRIFSVPDWKLLETLSGHNGPVHWAEFSADGAWVASAGEDKTMRVWSVASGTLVQTLQESQEPLLTVGFSPKGDFIAATSEKAVLLWQRQPTN